MQNQSKFLNYGLIGAALIPLAVILTICSQMLYTIWPDLDAKQQNGMLLGLAIISLPGVGAAAMATRALFNQSVLTRTVLAALSAVLLAAVYLYLFYVQPHTSLRTWMFDYDTYVGSVFSGLIPLFYFLLFYFARIYSIETRRDFFITILTAVFLPVAMYLGFNLIRHLNDSNWLRHTMQMIAIVAMTVFSFALLRLAVHVAKRNADKLQKPRTLWFIQLVCVGILPFVGLYANSYGGLVSRESQTMLGNFSHRIFWFSAAVNALVFLIPPTRHVSINLALVALRAAGFAFVLYFCTAFILFLPLAAILIALLGLGLLLLIPYIAILAQTLRLRMDIDAHTPTVGRRTVLAFVLLGFALPIAAVLAHIFAERSLLVGAIHYVERPPLDLETKNVLDAQKILAFANKQASSRRGLRNDRSQIPIYDKLYRSIVSDGAELSESLRKKIGWVFGAIDEFRAPASSALPQATLESAIARSTEGTSDLLVTVANQGTQAAEFSALLKLPENTYVTGHWLTIDGVEVPAQITTKSAAIWVYDRVTETRRDPSLIYYEGKNRLRWKIFPVSGKGTRSARLRIAHPHAVEITLASKTIQLKGAPKPKPVSEGMRRPYLHFVADCSIGSKTNPLKDARDAAQALGVPLANAKISFVNHSIHTTAFDTAKPLACPNLSGGFFVDLALRAIMRNNALVESEIFPVIVVLSRSTIRAHWEDLSFMTAFYSDSDRFFVHDGNKLKALDFYGAPIEPKLWVKPKEKYIHPPEGFADFYAYLLGDFQGRQRAVVHAIKTGVLNPAAGSIVLETEGQRRLLTELHKKMLNAVNELDRGNEPRMSEPWGLIAFALLFFCFKFFSRRREKKKQLPGI